MRILCRLLDLDPEVRATLRTAVSALSRNNRHSELCTSTGILPNTGFFTECFRRIGHKLLPKALDADPLRTTLRRAFSRPSDGMWVVGVGEESWLELVAALHFEERAAEAGMPHPIVEMLRSLRVLSFWIAAFGMEPELLRIDPTLETYESPFVAQNSELVAFIAAYPGAWRQTEAISNDDRHLRVLLNQCLSAIEKIRKRAARDGTSIRLTYHLHRLHQLIVRSEELLDILTRLLHAPTGRPRTATLFACSPA